ncbi:MAG: DUF177 domain-containing protein [Dehalococcoidia bacterium]|nr:DUF177 domain-containing protein [Dehalococcoidia bacterium]
MNVNVAQQLKEPVGSVRRYPVDEPLPPDNHLLTGELTFLRTGGGILVNGTLHTAVECVCSRCLEPFDCELTFQIEEEYFPQIDVLTGMPQPVPEEAQDFIVGPDHILDLADAFRQNVLLATPMKTICKPDCAGLCSGCGVNINTEGCRCAPEEVDPRWADLKKLMVGASRQKGRSEGANL